MPRKPIERSKTNFYHLTARSNNREFFYLPLLNVWDIMTRKLSALQGKHDIKIAAFVLMNNHFHLLLRTPNEDIDRVMYFFMKDVTLEIQKCTGRINKIFGGRYKGSMIDSYGYLVNVYKYIYRNPVEIGLCDRAEIYPYSTLFYKHQSSVKSPIYLENIIPKHAFDSYEDLDELKWINTRFEKHEADSISCGLQKTLFAYEKDRNTGRPIEPVVNHTKKKTQDELWNDMFPEEIVELTQLEYHFQ
jgi:putative transposase